VALSATSRIQSLFCAKLGQTTPKAQNSTAHHNAYFGKRALEEARGAAFAEEPRFCKLIIVRVSFVMAG